MQNSSFNPLFYCIFFLTGFLSNKFGRKGTLISSSAPFIVGWVLIIYADNIIYIYVGRLITGICVGLICVTTPPYLVEISTPDVRGLLGTSFQLFVVIGVLIVNGLGAVLHWKWLAVPSGVLVILALIGICFVPESPRWLIRKRGIQDAIAAVEYLHGDRVDASAECVAMDEDLRSEPKVEFSVKEIKKPEVVIPLLLSFSLVFFQQTTGSNAVLFYTVDIFKAASSSLDPNVATIIIDVVLVVSTALSSALIDKTGRKTLLVSSGLGMAVCLTVLGAYDCASVNNASLKTNYGWIPLVSLTIYIAAFSIGYGPIPWLMMAELTPVKYRSIICGAATAFCWLFVFIITISFESLKISIHDYGAYFLYAGFSVLSSIFAFFCLPETKGKQIEEIEQYFTSYFEKDTDSTQKSIQDLP